MAVVNKSRDRAYDLFPSLRQEIFDLSVFQEWMLADKVDALIIKRRHPIGISLVNLPGKTYKLMSIRISAYGVDLERFHRFFPGFGLVHCKLSFLKVRSTFLNKFSGEKNL